VGQRARLYASERVLIGPVEWYAGLPVAQAHVNAFLRRQWWVKHSPVRYVTLEHPSKGMSGAVRFDDLHWGIGFGYTSLCNLNVGHELTHVLVGVTRGTDLASHERDHNPKFAGAELEVVKQFCGAYVSDLLRTDFEARGVKYAPYE